ncbi:hypothetical protein FA893_08365 [Photobacterium damselae subsp. piscicida]|nr:hypothetical protein CTT35_11875 [Photobacterium damselae]PSW76985.1 hypothetical protein CTT37_12435 [Photobacterium damselae]TFZ56936.1 hypothetical protein E4T25_11955 [Photobacterium damselae subsp. piscicida]TJZ92799.1 hypothetical protein FA893_08365 [Photobacterium damselae subsp. piscicida]
MFDDEIVSVTRSQRASQFASHTALTIFNLEPLDLQIVVLPVNQIILAEPRILRLLEYKYDTRVFCATE